jgi:hypothetical protein
MVTAGDGDRPHLTKAYLSGGHSDDCISDTGANARSGAGQGLATERPSDETNRKQLDMARQEGKACFRSLLYMAHEVAHSGGQQRADDYIVPTPREKPRACIYYGPRANSNGSNHATRTAIWRFRSATPAIGGSSPC